MGLVHRGADKARRLIQTARRDGVGAAFKEARKNVWSTTEAYGFRRDLRQPVDEVKAAVDITLRRLEPRDLDYILDPESGDSPRQLIRQQRLVDAEVGTCWVAVDSEDRPLFMQWMIGAEDNERMRATFGAEFPPLAADEVLLEGAFIPRRHRGAGVLGAAVCQIIKKAPPEARWIWTYVTTDNVPTLKLAPVIGFTDAVLRRSKWRLLWHSTTFEPIESVPLPGS